MQSGGACWAPQLLRTVASVDTRKINDRANDSLRRRRARHMQRSLHQPSGQKARAPT